MQQQKRAELRIILANFVQIAARDPHEPDTMVQAVQWIEDWMDGLIDIQVAKAIGPLLKQPEGKVIDMLSKPKKEI